MLLRFQHRQPGPVFFFNRWCVDLTSTRALEQCTRTEGVSDALLPDAGTSFRAKDLGTLIVYHVYVVIEACLRETTF